MAKTERAPLDRYDTPDWGTRLLLREVPEIRGGTLLDPACGDKRMASLVGRRFRAVRMNDIDKTISGVTHEDAAHEAIWKIPFDWTVSNPPFCIASEILRWALEYSNVGVAFFLRISILEVCKGREFLAQHPPQRLIVAPRIKFRGASSDKVTCGWHIWSKRRLSGPPIVCVSKLTSKHLAYGAV